MPAAWYRNVFDRPAYLRLYEQMDRATAPAEAAGAAALLRLRPGERVLDLACGYGRHATELERLGFRALGVDLADALLRRAAQSAAGGAPATGYVRADLRALPFGPVFDAAASFFLSFGYFSDRENAAVLRQFAAVLRPGGRLLIDTWNPHEAAASRAKKFVEQREDAVIVQKSRFSRATRRLTWWTGVRFRDGGRERWRQSVRVYTVKELADLLRQAGFSRIRMFGNWDGRRFTPKAPRLLVRAAKPNRS